MMSAMKWFCDACPYPVHDSIFYTDKELLDKGYSKQEIVRLRGRYRRSIDFLESYLRENP